MQCNAPHLREMARNTLVKRINANEVARSILNTVYLEMHTQADRGRLYAKTACITGDHADLVIDYLLAFDFKVSSTQMVVNGVELTGHLIEW